MFNQKKTFSTIIVFYIFIQLCFSQVSIGGITVQNANSTNSETIETKYGKFTTKAGFPVLRYESGAIKSFYIEDFGYPTTFAKFYHPIYKVEIIVATPVPKEDYMSKQSAQALEFYENGNIKTLKLADVKYSYNKNGYLNIIFEKYNESLAIFPKSTIHFYENGNIKSIKVANGQSFKFLQDLKIDSKTPAVFKNQSEIVFYESGAIKEFTPQNANIKNALNFSIRTGSSVTVKEDDPSTAISFYPEKDSTIAFSDTIKVKCIPGEPLVFYENGTTLKQISWSFDVNFKIGNVPFYCGLNGETTKQTVYFAKSGEITSVCGILMQDYQSLSNKKTKSYFPALIEGQATSVRQIDYDKNGNIIMVDFGKNQLELVSTKTNNGNQTTKAWKIYYKNNTIIGAIVNVYTESSKGSFYDSNFDCIMLFKDNKIIQTINEGKDENFTADTTIFFDDSGTPISFTCYNVEGEIVQKTF